MAWLHGRVTSITPGIPTRVKDVPTPVQSVTFQALRANTGFVGIGGSNVHIQSGEQNALSLAVPATSTPQMQSFNGVDLFDLWIDVTVANEGVAYAAQV